jgi:hypothetical protein
MPNQWDLTGENIENTYQRVLQTPDGVNIFDGTGSAFTITAVAAPAGPSQSIQFNDDGVTSGSGNFTFDKGSNTVYITGSLIVTSLTGSLQGTASWADSASQALTASYYQETDPIFVAKSASLATTGSNAFIGNQIISGAVRLDPTQDPDTTGLLHVSSSFLFQSASNTALGYDLYIRQNGNLVKWKWVEGVMSTGLLYGGVVTYSGDEVYVSSGSGIIVEHNAVAGSEMSPIISYVTWPSITQSIANIATQQVTYLYIDQNGDLQQQASRFTGQQYHDYIPLGAVGHFDYTQVSAFGGSVQTAYDQTAQILTFVDAFGPLKVSGYGITGQAGSLRLTIGSGTSFIHGGFYENDPEFPSEITTPTQLTASIAYVYRSGSGIYFDTNNNNFYTVINPTKWDNGSGVLQNTPGGSYTNQRVYIDPKTGILYIYYGTATYNSITSAIQGLTTSDFAEGDTFDFTTFLGILVVKGNTTNVTNTSDAQILSSGLFRAGGVGGGGGGGTTSPGGSPGEIQYNNSGVFDGVPTLTYDSTLLRATGSFSGSFTGTYTGSFTGSLLGTASWADSASQALTASFIQTAQTASYVTGSIYDSTNPALSASYALTASYALNAGSGGGGGTNLGLTYAISIGYFMP